MKYFIDNSIAPIIAIDFDGTICMGDGYPDPHNGIIRPYAKEIMNFLYDVGAKVVIWTNRKNVKGTDIKDKLLMKQWLDEMNVRYHTVNDSTQFAPYKYYGRKLYAHMFVDDRGYGFDCDDKMIMIKVLYEFLSEVIGVDNDRALTVCQEIYDNGFASTSSIGNIAYLVRQWHRGGNDA